MKKHELIGALSWVICAIAPENDYAEGIFEILKDKEDMQVVTRLYLETLMDDKLRERFFPLEEE